MARTGLALLLAAVAGCAHVGAAPTRHRAGDYVVRRYSGLFSRQPVLVREQIVEQRGNRLTIEVTATRGDETRRWIQVVRDTPQDRAANRLEALYELKGGRRVRLENENNSDLFQLYEWTLLFPTGLREVRVSACTDTILGRTYQCDCHSALTTMMGHEARILERGCPGFLWRRGSVLVTDQTTGDVIQRVEVVEAGPPREGG